MAGEVVVERVDRAGNRWYARVLVRRHVGDVYDWAHCPAAATRCPDLGGLRVALCNQVTEGLRRRGLADAVRLVGYEEALAAWQAAAPPAAFDDRGAGI